MHHQQLGRGNRCHRHRPHEALCMGQVLQGFGKKKKSRHRQKKRVKRRSKPKELNPQAQFWRTWRLPKKRNCTSASRSASSWAKARIEPAYPGKGGPGNYQHFKPITIWTKFLSQSWNRLHRKCRNSLSSTRTTDNWNGSRRRPVPGHFPLCINRKYKLRLARPRIRGTEKRIRTDRPAGHRLLRRYSYASGTYDKVRERQQLAKKLYKSLQCLQCTDNASPLVREKSRSYAMPHYIKVYEMTFSFTLHDESAMPSSYGE